MLNLLFVSALADGAQVWSEISAASVHAMAVLASFFVKEHGTGLLAIARVSVNYRRGWLRQARLESQNNNHNTGSSKDSRYDFSISQEVNFSRCLIVGCVPVFCNTKSHVRFTKNRYRSWTKRWGLRSSVSALHDSAAC